MPDDVSPSKMSRVMRFLIGTPRRPTHEDSGAASPGEAGARAPDMMAAAIELVLTPIVFFGLGFLADRYFHTLPVFSVFGVLFGATGSVLKLYYSEAFGHRGQIGAGRRSSANIDSRPEGKASDQGYGPFGLLGGDLEVSDELRRLASHIDGDDHPPHGDTYGDQA